MPLAFPGFLDEAKLVPTHLNGCPAALQQLPAHAHSYPRAWQLRFKTVVSLRPSAKAKVVRASA